MRIGIDARVLSTRKAGVKTYLEEILRCINNDINNQDTYYLYLNKKIDSSIEFNNNFVIRKYNSLIGTYGMRHKVPKMLKRDKIDVFWGPAHVLPKKVKNVKYVLTVHDLATFRLKRVLSFYNGVINKLFLKKSAKSADAIIAISNATKNDLVQLFNINEKNIQVVYNSVTLFDYIKTPIKVFNDDFRSVSEKYNVNHRYFLYVGTIEPRKNIANIIAAFDIFKSNCSNDYDLIIAGGKGWRTKKIYKRYEQSEYKKNIIFTGYISQKEKEMLYRNATLLLFPSLYEGFGYPIIESLSVGTPVLTSNVSAMPEVGGDVCEYVNNPNDIGEISEKLEYLVREIESNKIDEMKLVDQSHKFQIQEFTLKTLNIIQGGNNDKN